MLRIARAAAAAAVGWPLAPRSAKAAEPVVNAGEATTPTDAAPRAINPGVQLFVDDDLIGHMSGLVRRMERPERLERPVLDSGTFGTTQPYLSVVRDAESQRFRVWYNHGPAIWHAESNDGIAWANPRLVWDLPRGYGCSVIDDGPAAADPARRYKLANWQATREREDKPGDDAGMWLGFSPDGTTWTHWSGNPALHTWPEGPNKFVRHGVGDTVDVYYDSLARKYRAAVKVHALAEDGYAPAPKAGRAFRRLIGMSASDDFLKWERPWRIFAPDAHDEGLLEFYGMGGMHVRGGLQLGLVRVLRDDLPCDPGGPVDGIGYTALATSRDGVHWHRFREPLVDRNLQPGSWDHAMAWGSAVVPVGDELYLYYGGYARGHKIAAETERQVGLARLKRDRYAALSPTADEGTLRTPPLVINARGLTLNARATGGQITVRVLDAKGAVLTKLGRAGSAPITVDSLAANVDWEKPLSVLGSEQVCLEFRLHRAALFACEFHA
ncbi:MAG: hypothetical protein AB7O59_06475 [Pirellulales bacterium]